jgi:hypothetical protein
VGATGVAQPEKTYVFRFGVMYRNAANCIGTATPHRALRSGTVADRAQRDLTLVHGIS